MKRKNFPGRRLRRMIGALERHENSFRRIARPAAWQMEKAAMVRRIELLRMDIGRPGWASARTGGSNG